MAFDTPTQHNTAVTGSSISWSHTIVSGSNRILTIHGSHRGDSGVSVSSATYNGQSANKRIEVWENTDGNALIALFDVLEASLPGSGSATVVVNYPSSRTYPMGMAIGFDGRAQQAPSPLADWDNDDDANGDSRTLTSVSANAIVVSAIRANDGSSAMSEVGSGGTQRIESGNTNSSSQRHGLSTFNPASAGNVTSDWDWSGSSRDYARYMAAYAVAEVPAIGAQSYRMRPLTEMRAGGSIRA